MHDGRLTVAADVGLTGAAACGGRRRGVLRSTSRPPHAVAAPGPADVTPLAPSPPSGGGDSRVAAVAGPRRGWPRPLDGLPGPRRVDDAARRVREAGGRLHAAWTRARRSQQLGIARSLPLVETMSRPARRGRRGQRRGLARGPSSASAADWPAAGAQRGRHRCSERGARRGYPQAAGGGGLTRRCRMPGRRGCGSACSTPRRTRPTAAGRSSNRLAARRRPAGPSGPGQRVNRGYPDAPVPADVRERARSCRSGLRQLPLLVGGVRAIPDCSCVPEPP